MSTEREARAQRRNRRCGFVSYATGINPKTNLCADPDCVSHRPIGATCDFVSFSSGTALVCGLPLSPTEGCPDKCCLSHFGNILK